MWQLGIYAGLFERSTSYEEGAKLFIQKIEDMNAHMQIGTKIDMILEKDIDELAQTAEKEANPLYPVPVLWTAEDLKKIYLELM